MSTRVIRKLGKEFESETEFESSLGQQYHCFPWHMSTKLANKSISTFEIPRSRVLVIICYAYIALYFMCCLCKYHNMFVSELSLKTYPGVFRDTCDSKLLFSRLVYILQGCL